MTDAGWQELRFATTPELVEALESWLFEHGALAVTLEDAADEPLLEPGPGETPLWQAIELVALFEQALDLEPLIALLPPHLSGPAIPKPEAVPDRDWERVWMDEFKPMKLGERLWVCPSWCEPPDPQAVNIHLDPGLAFGTGTHPTTALCLTHLDACIRPGMTVVDYGCGSGILAIAALKLGARHVLGVDNDPQAIIATDQNRERNDLPDGCLEVCLPSDVAAHDLGEGADVVVANILAGPLEQLSIRLIGMLRPGGELVLAGLLADQAPALIRCYAPEVTLSASREQAGWVMLSGVREG